MVQYYIPHIGAQSLYHYTVRGQSGNYVYVIWHIPFIFSTNTLVCPNVGL